MWQCSAYREYTSERERERERGKRGVREQCCVREWMCCPSGDHGEFWAGVRNHPPGLTLLLDASNVVYVSTCMLFLE